MYARPSVGIAGDDILVIELMPTTVRHGNHSFDDAELDLRSVCVEVEVCHCRAVGSHAVTGRLSVRATGADEISR